MAVRRLNHAVLYIREVRRSVEFYSAVLGFGVAAEVPGRAAFLRAPDSANDHDLGLFAIGDGAPAPGRGTVGLYHLAWEVGTLGELTAAREELVRRDALVGQSDHGVSKSLYAQDPDGIEFEVLWRVPREDWPEDGTATLPLDLPGALRRWGAALATGAAAGSAT